MQRRKFLAGLAAMPLIRHRQRAITALTPNAPGGVWINPNKAGGSQFPNFVNKDVPAEYFHFDTVGSTGSQFRDAVVGQDFDGLGDWQLNFKILIHRDTGVAQQIFLDNTPDLRVQIDPVTMAPALLAGGASYTFSTINLIPGVWYALGFGGSPEQIGCRVTELAGEHPNKLQTADKVQTEIRTNIGVPFFLTATRFRIGAGSAGGSFALAGDLADVRWFTGTTLTHLWLLDNFSSATAVIDSVTSVETVNLAPATPKSHFENYQPAWIRMGALQVGSYLERTTVPTGMIDDTDFYCVYTMRWPLSASGGGVRPIFCFGFGDTQFADYQYMSFLAAVGGPIGVPLDTVQHVQTRAGTFATNADRQMEQNPDTGLLETSTVTVGISCSDLVTTVFWAVDGAPAQLHVNSNIAPNIDPPGGAAIKFGFDALAIDRWKIGNSNLDSSASLFNFNKDITDIVFHQGVVVDFSNTAVIELFYKDGHIVQPAADGDYGFGQPHIMIGRGDDATAWMAAGNNRGSGGDFTHVGEAFINGPSDYRTP